MGYINFCVAPARTSFQEYCTWVLTKAIIKKYIAKYLIKNYGNWQDQIFSLNFHRGEMERPSQSMGLKSTGKLIFCLKEITCGEQVSPIKYSNPLYL